MNTFNEKTGKLRAVQKENTARKILKAAGKIFERVGYEKANIRDIAGEAGVAPGSVMNHFGDKTNLLHAALFEDLERVLKKTLQKLNDGPVEEALSKLTRDVFRYYQKRPRLAKVLLKESLFAAEPWSQKFAGQTATVHRAVERLCEEAKKKKEIRSDTDSALFAVSYLSFFYFALIAWVQGAHPQPVKMVNRLTEEYIRQFKRRNNHGDNFQK